MDFMKKKTAAVVYDAITSLGFGDATDIGQITDMLEYPPSPENGDLAFPCFRLSKVMRKAPPMIANELKEKLQVGGAISHFETVGGYLNFFFDKSEFAKMLLGEMLEKGERYGSSDEGAGKTVVLDYSSPNVAKPFHIGHLGTTVIGHSLKNIHEFSGYKCVGVNHLGDWGTQFGKLIVAYRNWGDRDTIVNGGIDELVKLYVRFHAEAEKDPSLDDLARAEFTKLENGDGDNRELWKWFIDISLAEYKKTYAQLGIEFDSYCGESFYYDKLPAVLETMKERGILTVDDGATMIDLEKYGMPPCLILKSDGSTLYAARDIAAALYRKNTYNFSKCIYVTDAGQSLHFKQWFKVISLMGYDFEPELVHVPYGKVSIGGAKLATRTGNVVLLKELFKTATEKVAKITEEKNPDLENKAEVAEAVGVGAIVYNYLSGGRIKNIDFTIEDALSFEGNTGPYAQYTYARTCSILAKAKESGAYGEVKNAEFTITANEEFELLKTLALFPEKVKAALDGYEPSVITRYIFDVATAFNHFYHGCQVLNNEDSKVSATRIALTEATGNVMKSAFGLICMKAPKKI